MEPVKVRNLKIGEGIPKICVPLVGVSKDEILEAAKEIKEIPMDFVEWRADWFCDILEWEKALEVLKGLRAILGDTPLLFTFRTEREGGKRALDVQPYTSLNQAASESGYVDMVDVELFAGEEAVCKVIAQAHRFGVAVIVSNHEFGQTPAKDEMIRRLCKMQSLGADLVKIAVMPDCPGDVLTLMAAVEEMHRKHADRPVIAMSMAGLGMASRLCGELFGSAVTFGAAGKASAPGQIDARELAKALSLLHSGLG